MAIRSDRVLIVDIEATCWDVKPPPAGQQSEIIEIGLCFYDLNEDHVYGKRSILVKPVLSEISDFCTSLTSITSQQVEQDGIEFAEACSMLVADYLARKTLWASWGSFDRKLFRKQCRRMGLSYPFGDKHMNVRKVFGQIDGHRRVGMTEALSIAGLEFRGRHHRGHDDAWNIALLLQHLARRHGLDLIRRHM